GYNGTDLEITGVIDAFEVIVQRRLAGVLTPIADPGTITTRGYYWTPTGIAPAGGITIDAPRKNLLGAGVSWRGQRDTAIVVNGAADIDIRSNIDDPGQSSF